MAIDIHESDTVTEMKKPWVTLGGFAAQIFCLVIPTSGYMGSRLLHGCQKSTSPFWLGAAEFLGGVNK